MADDGAQNITLKVVKRKAEAAAKDGGTKRATPGNIAVNPMRVRELKAGTVAPGPVLYWMTRDQRAQDNWALLHAIEVASRSNSSVGVVFNLVPDYLGAGARQFGFMLRGLEQVEAKLKEYDIPFFMLRGDPTVTIPNLVKETSTALLVTDFSPLRMGRQWRTKVAEALEVPFHEVDAHNVVPCWVASDKRETGARTIRRKINDKLPEYLEEFPGLSKQPEWTSEPKPSEIDWKASIAEVLERGKSVPEVAWCLPGEDSAHEALARFLTKARLGEYGSKRNDPNADAISGMSPYLHFGQISAARCALEAGKHRKDSKAAVDGFQEELIVRSELADNFCFYEPNYDSVDCAAGWAKETLAKHSVDKREWLYTQQQLEAGKTHDELWNAAQLEMKHLGKMHGFMRMYWAKKILEWTESPEEALRISIYLNDKYELDGRDPNGYVGCAWSICGIHDQGFAERPVFGKIRFMNYAGCKRKFKIDKYVAKVDTAIRKLSGGAGGGAKTSSMLNFLLPKQ